MKDKPFPVNAREHLVDRIGADFYAVSEQLTNGLQMVLEAHKVAPEVRVAVREFVADVVRDLREVEKSVVRLADPLGVEIVPMPDPLSGIDLKEHGHTTQAALRQELRADEAAGKLAHGYEMVDLHAVLGVKPGTPELAKELDRGIER